MGSVRISAKLESREGKSAERTFLVDTGSFYTAIDSSLRDELQLPPGYPAQVQVADGRIIDTEIVLARIRLLDREGIVPIEITNVPEPLIGVSALEALGVRVNPVTRELEYERPYGPPPSFTSFH
jgi:aspartyl protease family protein